VFKAIIAVVYFFLAVVFVISGMLVGTGIGSIIRGQINDVSIKYLIGGVILFFISFFIRYLLIKKVNTNHKKIRKISSMFGVIFIISVFVYLVN
jgi:hypothetical protein